MDENIVTIKVNVDEFLSFNIKIPTECSVEDFGAIVDRAKIIYRASGNPVLTGLKRGPRVEELPEHKPEYSRWTEEREKEFYQDYKNVENKKERFRVLGPKYGVGTAGSMEQKFYKVKKKYGLPGVNGKKDARNRSGISQGDKEQIIDRYNKGDTTGDIVKRLGIDREKVKNQIGYFKKRGKIERRGVRGRPSKRIVIKTEVESVLSNIFNKRSYGNITQEKRKEIVRKYGACETAEEKKSLEKQLGLKRYGLSKKISDWRKKGIV